MKRTALLLTSALFAISAYAVDSVFIKLNKNVNSYTQTEYSVTQKFGEYFRTAYAKKTHSFDASGKEIELTEYTPKDALIDKVSYAYDDKGNLVSSDFTDAEGKTVVKTVFTYNADGTQKDETEYDADGNLISKIIYKTDSGKKTDSLYDSEGRLLTRTIITYGKNSLQERVETYSGDGSLQTLDLYSYNDSNNVSQVLHSDKFEDNSQRLVYKYDASGFITEVQTYNNSNVLTERDIYKTDSNGNPTRISVYQVAKKFGQTTNELLSITEITYK